MKVFNRATSSAAKLKDSPNEVGQASAPAKSAKTAQTDAPSTSASPGACDSYEVHQPKPIAEGNLLTKVLDKVAPIRTHERVISEVKGSVFGLEVGITLSQLELVKKGTHGFEVIQVVNQDGSSNIETVLGRKSLNHNHRIELQGPAFNTSVTPGELPLGARFIGLGLTSDVTSAMDHDAVSYTAEVKLTTNSILELAATGGALGAAQVAADALTNVAGSVVGGVLADCIIGAVPILSAALAFQSARRAIHVLRDESAPRSMKAFAVAHALSDAVRVVFPLAGTLGNVALVGAAALMGWLHVRHAKHADPTGPPPEKPTPPATPSESEGP